MKRLIQKFLFGGKGTPARKSLEAYQFQEFLQLSGYNPGKIDGIIGENTIKAWDLLKNDYNRIGQSVTNTTNWRTMPQIGRKLLLKKLEFLDNKSILDTRTSTAQAGLFSGIGNLLSNVGNTISDWWNDKAEYTAKTIIPELQKLSKKDVRILRQSYNLSDKADIDDELIQKLSQDHYKAYSGFDLSNPITLHECAKYVNDVIRKRIGRENANKIGVRGSAWYSGLMLTCCGGREIYNIYTNPAFKECNGTEKSIKQITEKVGKSTKFDGSLLRIGDVVGLYYAPSHMHETAYKERKGKVRNTHVGIVTGYDKNGNPIISHNIHGKVYHDIISKNKDNTWNNKTCGGFIASVFRPWYKTPLYKR